MLSLLMKNRPTIAELWSKLERLPMGKAAFSRILGSAAPYTGTISAEVVTVGDGHAVVRLHDRRAVRNHLQCIHAIALMNLGEVATGLAMMHVVDGSGRGIIKELSMEYLKKARGTITAECNAEVPTESGTHNYLAIAELKDSTGELVARAKACWKVDIP